MQGCIAPSEIPGLTNEDTRVFGGIAESLIYSDFCMKYSRAGKELFCDDHNLSGYILFLAWNNPHFDAKSQRDYFERAYALGMAKIPDLLVHKPSEKAFYEIKPDSNSGIAAGIAKNDKIRIVYQHYHLPYQPGVVFEPRNHTIASYGTSLRIILRVRRHSPGLLVYKICLESEGLLELASLAVLLGYIVRELNRQTRFNPLDLNQVFRPSQQVTELAKQLGIISATAAASVVGWKYFWKAVAHRFAVRGTAAAALAAADGPLPIGDLIAAGFAVWTIIDIVRLNDSLWSDAAEIKRREA